MRFTDSNVFLHAYLVPRKRNLTRTESVIKDQAKEIVRKMTRGEEVALTVVHLSEVLNMMEAMAGLEQSVNFLAMVATSQTSKSFLFQSKITKELFPSRKRTASAQTMR